MSTTPTKPAPAPAASAEASTSTTKLSQIPSHLKPYTENTTTILLPSDNSAFLNPVQQFNRDLSVACITTWGKIWQEEKRKDWEAKHNRKLKKAERGQSAAKKAKLDPEAEKKTEETESAAVEQVTEKSTEDAEASTSAPKVPQAPVSKFIILEALSATGLRSIRYAKEIPGVRYVIANDLSPTACDAMRMNVAYNELGPSEGVHNKTGEKFKHEGKVRVNEGDACDLMYSHRPLKNRVEMVDLDPYGTAAPFIDPAIQCVADGGLLAVTCTDAAVLAGSNYPEKARVHYSNYGGVSSHAKFSHEVGIRLILHSLSTTAARYGRYIVPYLSLSIDFYMRVFVRVYSGALPVKNTFANNGVAYICHHCDSFHIQPFGKIVEKTSANGNVNTSHKNTSGPPCPNRCVECGSTFMLAGPMWLGPLHKPDFCKSVIEHVDSGDNAGYGTIPRIKGMVGMAAQELTNPFFFSPTEIAKNFRAEAPSMAECCNALFNGGYQVSRSHCVPGSIKTDASCEVVRDIMRAWFKKSGKKPRMDKMTENSPAWNMNMKKQSHELNFETHPSTAAITAKPPKSEGVRYQDNPLPNWGPAPRANNGPAGGSKKRTSEEAGLEVQSIGTLSDQKAADDAEKKRIAEEEAMNA